MTATHDSGATRPARWLHGLKRTRLVLAAAALAFGALWLFGTIAAGPALAGFALIAAAVLIATANAETTPAFLPRAEPRALPASGDQGPAPRRVGQPGVQHRRGRPTASSPDGPVDGMGATELGGRSRGGLVAMAGVALPGCRPGPVHQHGSEEEIFFVLAGSGLAWLDGAVHEIGVGDTIVYLAGGPEHTVIAGPDFTAALARSRSKPAELVASLMPMAGIDSHPAAIHDACVVGLLLWPELFHLERGVLHVVTRPGPSEGRTLWSRDAKGPHQLVVELDCDLFLKRMARRLAGREEA